jgi:uncharacterized membrane protein
MISLTRRVEGIDSHIRVSISLTFAALVFALLFSRVTLGPLIIITWNAFAIAALGLAWVHIVFADPVECIRSAKLQDSSRTLIFIFVIASALASLFAIGFLLRGGKALSAGRLTEHVVFAIVTVVSSWLLIHTVFSLRYAHIYYGLDEHAKEKGERTALEFPKEDSPAYLDFAYFSFVIGMCCQVSDVQVCSQRVRGLVLIHGLLSFLFNTVIVSLSINIVSGLL